MIDLERKAILNASEIAVDEAISNLEISLCNNEWIYLVEILDVLISLEVI